MAGVTLSAVDLNRTYLHRQLLLRRLRLSPAEALRRLVAVQAQYSPSPYLALAARLDGFTTAALEASLTRGTVVKATLMRGTLHLTAAEDFAVLAGALRESSLRYWERTFATDSVDTVALTAKLTTFLGTPRSADEIREHVEAAAPAVFPERQLLNIAKLLVPTVHATPSGFWRVHTPPRISAWPAPLPSTADGARAMVRAYLAGYGPATRADVAAFTTLPMSDVDAALTSSEAERRWTDEQGRDLYDLPGSTVKRASATPPPRLLPKWDSALLSHADRTRILPEDLRAQVIRRANGDVAATYLLDGFVAGRWRIDRDGPRAVVRLTPLRSGADHGSVALEDEARRTAAFCEPDASDVDVVMSSDAHEPSM